jgi:ABC-type nickel/cobalt efflux system permease component RcnA
MCAAAILASSPAWAGPGHDHGDAAPAAVGQTLPRFSAVSETFELVGVLSGKQITLYLDRFADNSPVRGAQIELEIGGAKFKAEKHGDDEYEVVLPDAPKAGVLPVTATVTAGNEADLLAGELDIRADAHAHEHAHEHAHGHAHTHSRKEYAAWAGAGLCTLALLALGGRRVIRARSVRAGAPA